MSLHRTISFSGSPDLDVPFGSRIQSVVVYSIGASILQCGHRQSPKTYPDFQVVSSGRSPSSAPHRALKLEETGQVGPFRSDCQGSTFQQHRVIAGRVSILVFQGQQDEAIDVPEGACVNCLPL